MATNFRQVKEEEPYDGGKKHPKDNKVLLFVCFFLMKLMFKGAMST